MHVGRICKIALTFVALFYVVCADPAGMEDNSIPDVQIKASTYTDIIVAKNLPHYARLNHGTCWVPDSLTDGTPWLQVTLKQQQYITGVMTQGKDISWITQFKVEINSVFVSDNTGGACKGMGV